MNGKSALSAITVASMLISLAALGTPAAGAVEVTATAGDNSVSVAANIAVTVELDNLCDQFRAIMQRENPIWDYGMDIPEIPGRHGTGILGGVTRDRMIQLLDNVFRDYQNKYRDYGENFRAANRELCENAIRAVLANSNVQDFSMVWDTERAGNRITIGIEIGFTLKGADVFRTTPEGKVVIDFSWRSVCVGGKADLGVYATLDYGTFKPIDLSCFDVPLTRWENRVEGTRLVLTYTRSENVDVSCSCIGRPLKVTVDPTATLRGPEGSADATVKEDGIVLPAPAPAAAPPTAEKPPLVRPEVLVALGVVAMVIVGGIAFAVRRRK